MSRNTKDVLLILAGIAILILVIVVAVFEVYVAIKLLSFASDAGWTSHDGIIYTSLALLLIGSMGSGASNRRDRK